MSIKFSVCTLFRGEPTLTRGLLASYAVQMRGYRNTNLFAGCNNEQDKLAVEAAQGTPVDLAKFTGKDERARIEHVADLWLQILSKVDTDYVVLWDDDVVPPAGALRKLLQVMTDAGKEIAGCVSIYPFRENNENAVLFHGDDYQSLAMQTLDTSVFEVRGGGMGFSIWRTIALLGTLPWEILTLDGGSPAGFDKDIALKLEAQGLKTLCEGSVRCRHIA